MLYLKSAQRPRNPRVRALFVENMSGPVLQMLGTMCAQFPSIQMFEFTGAYVSYNIEPFFLFFITVVDPITLPGGSSAGKGGPLVHLQFIPFYTCSAVTGRYHYHVNISQNHGLCDSCRRKRSYVVNKERRHSCL